MISMLRLEGLIIKLCASIPWWGTYWHSFFQSMPKQLCIFSYSFEYAFFHDGKHEEFFPIAGIGDETCHQVDDADQATTGEEVGK